jgi:hypothetical protein
VRRVGGLSRTPFTSPCWRDRRGSSVAHGSGSGDPGARPTGIWREPLAMGVLFTAFLVPGPKPVLAITDGVVRNGDGPLLFVPDFLMGDDPGEGEARTKSGIQTHTRSRHRLRSSPARPRSAVDRRRPQGASRARCERLSTRPPAHAWTGELWNLRSREFA